MKDKTLCSAFQWASQEEELLCMESFAGERIQDSIFCIEGKKLNIQQCQFINCDFSHSTWEEVSFKGCDFQNCNFQHNSFLKTQFLDCRGTGCDMGFSYLKQCWIRQGSWQNANFAQVRWNGGGVFGVHLQGSVFSQSRLEHWQAVDSQLTGAEFCHTSLKNLDLSTCEIQGLILSQGCSELKGAVFSPAQAVEVASFLGVRWRDII